MRSVCLYSVYTYIGLCIYPPALAITIHFFFFASDYYVQKAFYFYIFQFVKGIKIISELVFTFIHNNLLMVFQVSTDVLVTLDI